MIIYNKLVNLFEFTSSFVNDLDISSFFSKLGNKVMEL